MRYLILFLFIGLCGLYAQPSTCLTPELDSLIKELNLMELKLSYDKEGTVLYDTNYVASMNVAKEIAKLDLQCIDELHSKQLFEGKSFHRVTRQLRKASGYMKDTILIRYQTQWYIEEGGSGAVGSDLSIFYTEKSRALLWKQIENNKPEDPLKAVLVLGIAQIKEAIPLLKERIVIAEREYANYINNATPDELEFIRYDKSLSDYPINSPAYMEKMALVRMEEPYYTQMIADSLAIWMPMGRVELNDEIKFMRARPVIDVIIKLLDSERYYVDYSVAEDYHGNKHSVRRPPVYQRHKVLSYLMEVTDLPIVRKGGFANDENVAFAKQWFKDHPDYKIIK